MNRILKRIGITLIVGVLGTYLLLTTVFNEALHIRSAYPSAQVGVYHANSPDISVWDFFRLFVPGDYIGPSEWGAVTITDHETTVDIQDLLRYRTQYIILKDCDVSNIEPLISPEYSRPVFLIRDCSFIELSPEASSELEKRKHNDEATGSTDYWFGVV